MQLVQAALIHIDSVLSHCSIWTRSPLPSLPPVLLAWTTPSPPLPPPLAPGPMFPPLHLPLIPLCWIPSLPLLRWEVRASVQWGLARRAHRSIQPESHVGRRPVSSCMQCRESSLYYYYYYLYANLRCQSQMMVPWSIFSLFISIN